MLLNPNPTAWTSIPNNPSSALKFKYVFLVGICNAVNKVTVTGQMYIDDQYFFDSSSLGSIQFGDIDFNINDAGLLTTMEDFAITMLPGFTSCNVPVPPIDEGQ